MARNSDVSPYIGKLSRSKLFAKKGLYKREHKAAPAAAGKANGEKRTVTNDRAPAFYPSEDVKQPKASRKTVKPTKIRASITKGTVLILLAGRFRGKVCIYPPFFSFFPSPFRLNLMLTLLWP
jgi:large subunit ribosomal protein L6e